MSHSIWGAAVLGALAGFLGGASFHLLAADVQPAVASPVGGADAADVDRLVRALARLTDELQRLLEEPLLATPGRAEGAAPVRVPVEVESGPMTGPPTAEWTAAIDELTAALRRRGVSSSAPAALSLPPPQAPALALPLLRTEDEAETLKRSLLLRGYQDVLDRYGIPDKIHPRQSGAVSWRWGRPYGQEWISADRLPRRPRRLRRHRPDRGPLNASSAGWTSKRADGEGSNAPRCPRRIRGRAPRWRNW